jgi:hypothetical protein
MNNKPVTPAMHGIIDYVFSGIQLAAPPLLGLNKTAAGTYMALGAGFLAVNALTDTPVAIKPVLSFETHQKADTGFLAGLALLTAPRFIRNDKRALVFHFSFLAVAVTHYILTDYKAGSRS